MRSRIIHIQVETAEAVAQETTPAEEVNETLFGVNVQVRTYDHVFDVFDLFFAVYLNETDAEAARLVALSIPVNSV